MREFARDNNVLTIPEIIEQLTVLKSLIEWDLPIDYQVVIDEAVKIIKEKDKDDRN